MYVLSFLYYVIWYVIIFGYIIKLHIIITKCHTLYVGKTAGVASECIAYRSWQFSAEDARMQLNNHCCMLIIVTWL